MLRSCGETFVGPESATVTSAPEELLQAAEFREFVFGNDPPSFPQPLLQSADRVLIIVLDAQSQAVLPATPNETEAPLIATLGPAADSFAIINVMLRAPESLFDPAFQSGRVCTTRAR